MALLSNFKKLYQITRKGSIFYFIGMFWEFNGHFLSLNRPVFYMIIEFVVVKCSLIEEKVFLMS